MTQMIEIDPNWHKKIQKLVTKFNDYAKKRSLNSVSEIIEKLADILDHAQNTDLSLSDDAYQALIGIRTFNHLLFTPEINETLRKKEMFNSNNLTQNQDDFASYLESMTPKESRFIYPKDSSVDDIPDYSELDGYLKQYSSDSKNLNVNEENYADNSDNSSTSYDSGGDIDALMAMSVEELNLQNIKRVQMRDEFNKRKCALGDGELSEYNGPLYQCTCGTLYHETCLKIQAIYVGKCAICDRIFRL